MTLQLWVSYQPSALSSLPATRRCYAYPALLQFITGDGGEAESSREAADDFIKDLEQEITELKRRDTELEQLSHTEDHLHLLQIYPSLCTPPHTKNWTDISIDSHLSVETVRNALSQLQKSLKERLTETVKEKIRESVDVTLDADTAHPKLILSDGGKQLTHGDTK
ncbi:hypothetical protein SRHO_G00028080 [Serrasalmus rhombeus]